MTDNTPKNNRPVVADASKKNFGFGNQMGYAGKQGIRAAVGDGRHDRTHQQFNAWDRFCTFLQEHTLIKDARDITIEIVIAFALALRERMLSGEIGSAMVQNEICHVNVALEKIRGDRTRWVKPGDYCARRSQVRKVPPGGIDREVVAACAADIQNQGLIVESVLIRLMRSLGLRSQEAVSLDCRTALAEAEQTGKIVVHRGTKGGRVRTAPASAIAIEVLAIASSLQGDRNNLIPPTMTREQFLDHFILMVTPILRAYGIQRPHDLRAAFGCEIYQIKSGYPAPVVAGRMVAPKSLDREARQYIAAILGHGRTDVVSSYVGSAR